jgi:Trk-type K+ transport system membrane component
VRRAAIILVSGVVVVCVSALLIVIIDQVAFDRAVVLATAAFATTSMDASGVPLSEVVTTILSVGMLWGRVGVFLIVSAFYDEKLPKNVQKQTVWLG